MTDFLQGDAHFFHFLLEILQTLAHFLQRFCIFLIIIKAFHPPDFRNYGILIQYTCSETNGIDGRGHIHQCQGFGRHIFQFLPALSFLVEMFKTCQVFTVMKVHILQLREKRSKLLHIPGHKGNTDTVQVPQFIFRTGPGTAYPFRCPVPGSFHFAVNAFRFCTAAISAKSPGNHTQDKCNGHTYAPFIAL